MEAEASAVTSSSLARERSIKQSLRNFIESRWKNPTDPRLRYEWPVETLWSEFEKWAEDRNDAKECQTLSMDAFATVFDEAVGVVHLKRQHPDPLILLVDYSDGSKWCINVSQDSRTSDVKAQLVEKLNQKDGYNLEVSDVDLCLDGCSLPDESLLRANIVDGDRAFLVLVGEAQEEQADGGDHVEPEGSGNKLQI